MKEYFFIVILLIIFLICILNYLDGKVKENAIKNLKGYYS